MGSRWTEGLPVFKDLMIGWKSLRWRLSKSHILLPFEHVEHLWILSWVQDEHVHPGMSFSEVRRPWNSQIHGKLSVCSWSTAAVGAILNVNMYLWISLLHCLLLTSTLVLFGWVLDKSGGFLARPLGREQYPQWGKSTGTSRTNLDSCLKTITPGFAT